MAERTVPLMLPPAMAGTTHQNSPKAPLFEPSPQGVAENLKPRTRRQAIRKKAFGPMQRGAAFRK